MRPSLKIRLCAVCCATFFVVGIGHVTSSASGEDAPEGVTLLVGVLADVDDPATQLDLLDGMFKALEGRRSVTAPASWATAYAKLSQSSSNQVRERAVQLALVFGDRQAIKQLLSQVRDQQLDVGTRRESLQLLVQYQVKEVVPDLLRLLDQPELRSVAIRSLASFQDPRTIPALIPRFEELSTSERSLALATLSSRREYATALLEAVEAGTIPVQDVTAFHARQIESLESAELSAKLRELWGDVVPTTSKQKRLIARYKRMMTSEFLERSDPKAGRLLFKQHCMACHKLYGEGGDIGPDITGSNRDNMDYLLENILTPSAVVPKAFQLKTLLLSDGRVLNGFLIEESTLRLTVQTANERVVLDRTQVDLIKDSDRSMMPDGLAEKLSDEQFRDLLAYLKKKELSD